MLFLYIFNMCLLRRDMSTTSNFAVFDTIKPVYSILLHYNIALHLKCKKKEKVIQIPYNKYFPGDFSWIRTYSSTSLQRRLCIHTNAVRCICSTSRECLASHRWNSCQGTYSFFFFFWQHFKLVVGK